MSTDKPQPSINSLREIRPEDGSPSCHVCGAIMVPAEKGFKCLSCGATTEPTGPEPSVVESPYCFECERHIATVSDHAADCKNSHMIPAADPSPQASPAPRAWTCSECHQSNLLSDTVCQLCRKIIRIDDNPKRQFQYGTYIACCLCNCNVAGNKTCQYNCICHDNAESRVTAPVGHTPATLSLKQLKIDLSNLEFYAEQAEKAKWFTEGEIIHWNVVQATLREIAKRYEAEALASPPQIAQPLPPYIFCHDCRATVEYIRDPLENAEDIVCKDAHHIICTFHEKKVL